MKMNQNGFSLIELMAVLVLFSVAIVPLLFSFTNSIQANRDALTSRKAATVGDNAINALEKISYTSFNSVLDTNDFIVFDYSTCNQFGVDTNDEKICQDVFLLEAANLSFTSDDFKMFVFDYSLTQAEHDSIVAGVNAIAPRAAQEIDTNLDILGGITPTPPANQNLLWVVIWLRYDQEDNKSLVITGIIANDDPDYYN